MAIVKCKECGKNLSNKAASCPHCGAKMPRKTSLLTWLVLAFILYGVYIFSKDTENVSQAADSSGSSSTTVSDKPKVNPSVKLPQWTNTDSTDEMSGKRSAYTLSPTITPNRPMEFPYSNVDSWLVVGCTKSSEWAYVGFSRAPNLVDTENGDGYNVIKARVKWGESLDRETFTQKWSAKSIHFDNYETAIQKISASGGMMLELKWHGQGAVHFSYPLDGASKAIGEMRAACRDF